MRSDEGSALVELAVSLPILVLLVAGAVDFARVYYTGIALTTAARAGVRYGAANLGQSGDTATMQSTATAATNVTGITAVASRSCQCAGNSGTFSATSPSANNCAAAETTSCPGAHRVITVTVTTSKTFTRTMGVIPGLPASVALTRSATLRATE